MFFRKRKKEEKEKGVVELGYGHFKRYLFVLMERLVQAYQTMPLSWWHALISFFGEVFFGVFLGYILTSLLLPPGERVIVIPLNETHIIRVKVP